MSLTFCNERNIKQGELFEVENFLGFNDLVFRLVGLHSNAQSDSARRGNKHICPMSLLPLAKQIEKLNISVLLIEG